MNDKAEKSYHSLTTSKRKNVSKDKAYWLAEPFLFKDRTSLVNS